MARVRANGQSEPMIQSNMQLTTQPGARRPLQIKLVDDGGEKLVIELNKADIKAFLDHVARNEAITPGVYNGET